MYKMNLDSWDCFGREKKALSYNQRNTVYYHIFIWLKEGFPLPRMITSN